MKMLSVSFVLMFAAIGPLTSLAMPTKDDLEKTAPLVRELIDSERKKYEAGECELTDVAAFAVDIAENRAQEEAARLLLMKGAIDLYAHADATQQVQTALAKLKTFIPDIPLGVVANIIESALSDIPMMKCAELRALQSDLRIMDRAMAELPKLEAEIAQSSADKGLCRQAAEHYLVLGNWEKALNAFSRCGDGKLSEIVSAERSGDGSLADVADFWWSSASGKSAEVADCCRLHAAGIYKAAMAADEVEGLRRVMVERRISKCRRFGGVFRDEGVVLSRRGVLCVVDLSGGSKASRHPVAYANSIPVYGWPREYKTDKLVLMKIKPGSFRYLEDKRFTITKPFYIGVFEVTQRQYELVMGYNPSKYLGMCRPVESVAYLTLRGKEKGLAWPTSVEVDDDSFMARIREKTGLEFDLPTEVQWEYACRAKTISNFNDGSDDDLAAERLGRYALNGGERFQHTEVGSYPPNAWGLYDMHGNVFEFVLDHTNLMGLRGWRSESKEREIDPYGIAGTNCIRRGGGWNSLADALRSNARMGTELFWNPRNTGFRLAVSADGKDADNARPTEKPAASSNGL